jgi:hypothetical protein
MSSKRSRLIWVAVDNQVYLWDYTHPNPELVGFVPLCPIPLSLSSQGGFCLGSQGYRYILGLNTSKRVLVDQYYLVVRNTLRVSVLRLFGQQPF